MATEPRLVCSRCKSEDGIFNVEGRTDEVYCVMCGCKWEPDASEGGMSEPQVIQIDTKGKYVLIFRQRLTTEDMVRVRERVNDWFKSEDQPFLVITGDVVLEKIDSRDALSEAHTLLGFRGEWADGTKADGIDLNKGTLIKP
jgi:hypothetical protein